MFAFCWVMMLQNYIHNRKQEIDDPKRKETDIAYREGSGRLMQVLLDFWAKTKDQLSGTDDGLTILRPSHTLAN